MKRSTVCSILSIFLLIPATLFLGMKLPGRWYYLTSTMIIIETMIPFFLAFEKRRPQARELVTIAVMAAIAAVSRAAFAFIPNFKPILGIIMITGIAFGAETGFLTGTVAAFASNFFFGQGPYTPWQMMAYGFGGFLAGLLFHKKRKLHQKPLLYLAVLTVFGFVSIVAVVGPLLDCCTIFTTGAQLTWAYALACFASGFPINVTHGIACALTMLLLSKPLLDKLDRLKTKYGMMEAGSDGL